MAISDSPQQSPGYPGVSHGAVLVELQFGGPDASEDEAVEVVGGGGNKELVGAEGPHVSRPQQRKERPHPFGGERGEVEDARRTIALRCKVVLEKKSFRRDQGRPVLPKRSQYF